MREAAASEEATNDLRDSDQLTIFTKKRVRDIVYQNEDIGRIPQDSCDFLAQSTQLFLEQFLYLLGTQQRESVASSSSKPSKAKHEENRNLKAHQTKIQITAQAIKQNIDNNTKYDFLRDIKMPRTPPAHSRNLNIRSLQKRYQGRSKKVLKSVEKFKKPSEVSLNSTIVETQSGIQIEEDEEYDESDHEP